MKIPAPHLTAEAPESAKLAAADTARRKPAAENAADTGRAHTDRAQVQISPVSVALLQDSGDVDLARVEAIRNAIRSGELQVDAGRIADGLLDSARELIQR